MTQFGSETLTWALSVVGFYYIVMQVIGYFSGWQKLALVYSVKSVPTGSTVKNSSLRLRNHMGYNGCVVFTVNSEGLGIELWPLLKFGHSDLFIPWNEIKADSEQNRIGKRVFLVIQKVSSVPITVTVDTVERFEQYLGRNWQSSEK